jgi:hypothetical protein
MNPPRPRTPDEEVISRSSFDLESKGLLTPTSSIRSRSSSLCSVKLSPMAPKWIILGLWPHATDDQVHYYIRGYASLYPTAKLLLLPHHPRAADHHIHDILLDLTDDKHAQPFPFAPPDTLIHLFGDAAATQVCRLLRSYRARTQRPLAVKALVCDAVPVVPVPSLHTLRTAPCQLFTFLFLALLCLWSSFVALLTLWFAEPFSTRVRQDLYDPEILREGAKKCYVFPEKDVMFAWDDEEDADEGGMCERKEFLVKRADVGRKDSRWSGDQERYWGGIENAWGEGR